MDSNVARRVQSPDLLGAFACPEGRDVSLDPLRVVPAPPARAATPPRVSAGAQLAQLEALARRELAELQAAAPAPDASPGMDPALASLAWDLGLDVSLIG